MDQCAAVDAMGFKHSAAEVIRYIVFDFMMGGEPRMSFAALKGEMVITRLDEEKLRAHVKGNIDAQGNLHKEMVNRRKLNRKRERKEQSRGESPNLTVGDFVPVGRTRKASRNVKLVSKWVGLWRVVSGDRDGVCTMEHIVPAETRDIHIASTQFYADKK